MSIFAAVLSNALKGHIALFVAQVIYALNYSIAKGLMPNYMGPLAMVFMRILGAGLLFWILSLFVKTQKVEKQDLKRIALIALFGAGLNQIFLIYSFENWVFLRKIPSS